jgi:hypothetical protein
MRIYFCGSILGGRQNAAIYPVMVHHLESRGHQVLTKHVAWPDVVVREQGLTPQEVYRRDMDWLALADTVVAEVTTPSLGVGYEIAVALQLAKPTLCVYRQGTALTKLLAGNTSPGIAARSYATEEELLRLIDAFLQTPPVAGAARIDPAAPQP